MACTTGTRAISRTPGIVPVKSYALRDLKRSKSINLLLSGLLKFYELSDATMDLGGQLVVVGVRRRYRELCKKHK